MCVISAVTRAVLAVAAVAAVAAVPGPALRCQHERCRYLGRDRYNDHRYEVDGHNISISSSSTDFMIYCDDGSVLESPALPRAEPALRVPLARLLRCPPPAAGSLAGALAALAVTLECSAPAAPDKLCDSELIITDVPGGSPRHFAARHFVGLEQVVRMSIFAGLHTQLNPERGFLEPLRRLRSLVMGGVTLPTALHFPLSLRNLEIVYIDGDKGLPDITPLLKSLKVTNWAERLPAPLAQCDSLRELHLSRPAATALPAGWLASCSRLLVLDVSEARFLTALPPKLLVGASALTHLTLRKGRLETLPAELLNYSPNLHTLQLDKNSLQTLPSGIFAASRRLQELDMSLNDLEDSVLAALAPLDNLAELNLANNSRLGFLCEKNGYSLVRNLTKLRKLLLNGTSVTKVCRDWRQDMTLLETLDLSLSNVTTLSLEELQFTRSVRAEVVLLEVPVTMVRMTHEDFNNVTRGQSNNVSVRLDCDCRTYRMRQSLDRYLYALDRVGELRCADGRRLRDVAPEDMECARPGECAAAALPAACACSVQPDDDSHHDRLLVRVRCESAALLSVPRFPTNTKRIYELLLAHNNISHVHEDDLQDNIKALDLRNNSLREVDEGTARRLGELSGTLRLAGNPLECSCRAAPLLRALLARNNTRTRTDLSAATCDDGRPLDAALVADCSPDMPLAVSLSIGLASVLAVLLALALAAVVCLASRERRFFARAVLHRWGVAWYAAEPEDDGRRYDAFVTFSHKDEEVVRELMARLEPAYRLCVHVRDWVPGRYIGEQVAESVRESRRTVALVSRHFLASSWARAEFREAHTAAMLDARPRLVVLLLEEPAALEMDEQLRRYVATQTYLRWGEPWFWHKLAVALPRPRAPPPDPGAPPPALALELMPAPAGSVVCTPR